MPRRRPLPPDTRPRWNDPDLKSPAFNERLNRWELVSEKDREGISRYRMNENAKTRPYYFNDPTYHLDTYYLKE